MKLRITLADKAPFYVDTRPVDNVRYEEVAQKHKWGTAQESPMRFMYFLAFAACSREGHVARESGFSAFLDELVDVDPEGTDEVDANPTERAPMPE
jgi:hypothetical protein